MDEKALLEAMQAMLEAEREHTGRMMDTKLSTALEPINIRLERLEVGQQAMQVNMETIQVDITGVKQEVVNLKQDVAGVKQDIADVKQVQRNSAVFENEMERRTGILLDAVKGIQDRFDRQDAYEEKVEDLELRVSAIEMTFQK